MSFALRISSDGSIRVDLDGVPTPGEWAFLLDAIECVESLRTGAVEPESPPEPVQEYRAP